MKKAFIFSGKGRILLMMMILFVTVMAPLSAYPRISLGASWAGMSLQGTVAGQDYGTMTSKSQGVNVMLEGEMIPLPQWSIVLRAQTNVFSPAIVSGGKVQPQHPDGAAPFTATGRFGLATGWQMPFSDWTLRDFPLDLTIGLGALVDLMHLSYDTPRFHYSGTEIALGACAYMAVSWYFSPLFGLSFSTMPALTVMDWTTATTTATGGGSEKVSSLTFTSLKLSWDATIAATIRFGW